MGLDAAVFCDCIEKGCLRVRHPHPRLLHIDSNGSPEIQSKDPVKVDEHDKWMNLPLCDDESMMLPGGYQASAEHISHLNRIFSGVLRKHGQACPVLLGKVLYSGTHCGDRLAVQEVRMLSNELERLEEEMRSTTALSGGDARQGALAIGKPRRLVKAALAVNKPVAF